MNKLTKIAAASVVALGLGLGMAGQAQAAPFIIDDFNFTTSASVTDNTVDGIQVTGARGTGGTVMNGTAGWGRGFLFANLTGGDAVSTQDCASCQQGHFINDANSSGHGYWSWSGPSINLNGLGGSISFEFSTDVPGADLILSLGSGATKLGEIWWKDLLDTNNVLQTLSAALPGGLSNITYIALDAFSVGGNYTDPTGWLGTRNYGNSAVALDINVDNVTIPEPATLALMGLGLAGLGWSQRRRTA